MLPICMSIPSQVMCDGHVKVFNGIHIFKDRSLLSVISLCFVCSFPSYLHNRGYPYNIFIFMHETYVVGTH